MDRYDGMGMQNPYLSSPMGLPALDVPTLDADGYRGGLPTLGLSEHMAPSYDTSDFGIPDNMPGVPYMQPSLPQESSHSYHNAYEDAFADPMALMESIPPDHVLSEDASIDRDNKLLSFQSPTYNFTLLDISLRRTGISIAAQLHGMFFMAESQDQGLGIPTTPHTELTCYRRNLFQITGSITMPRALRYIMTDNGDHIPIIAQELCISATESVEGHPVKLISVPWKTPISNNSSTPEDKIEKEPAAIPLDTMSNQDMDADFATFPIAWKRLQFRIATANNGRRKELQQHFVVRLKVVAMLSTGARVSICEARSGAIIVRGRSPRNFQARKDLPVGANGLSNRRAVPPPIPLSRNSTADSGHKVKLDKSPDSAHATLDNQEIQTPSTFGDWSRKSNTVSTSRGNNYRNVAAPFHASTHSASASSTTPPRPKALSLDSPDREAPPHLRATKVARTASVPSSASAMTNPAFLSSHVDSADLLYEYFPLGLDDWQPPVDAVYRPHVVHHIAGPQVDATSGARMGRPSLGGRSKRYFTDTTFKPQTMPALSTLLPPLICGTATFNDQYNPDPYALPTTAIVHEALSLGVRAFDTSPYYGPAEDLLGAALNTPFVKQNYPRRDYFLLTKLGRISGDEFDYSKSWVRHSVQRSLERLHTSYLDVVYCHDVEFVSPEEALTAVKELRRIRDETGSVKYVGISGYPVTTLCELSEMILRDTGEPLDVVMSYANFTLQNTRLASVALPRFEAAGVDVVPNASVLGMGLLRRKGVPIGAHGDFHPSPQGLRAAIQAASDWSTAQDIKDNRIEKVAIRWALENWMREGAEVGSTGDPASGIPWTREKIEKYGGSKRGVSVMGVSNLEELRETMRVWRSILDGLEGGEKTAVCAGRSLDDRTWSLQRQEHVRILAEGVRKILGEWVDYTWPSPAPGFVNKRSPRGVPAPLPTPAASPDRPPKRPFVDESSDVPPVVKV
ncbi:MAG: hypothetical protein Q9218_002629 [Villophora microphyllina]